MKKLAVFFPGIGYNMDKPLLYYARKIVSEYEYEIFLLSFSGFPEKKPGDPDWMKAAAQLAVQQSVEQMKSVDLSKYRDIVFIGKSIGTIAAAAIASERHEKDRIRMVLFTPLEETFSVPVEKAIVFTGSNDPWVGKENSRIPELCEERGLEYYVTSGGNHSLECGKYFNDAANLLFTIRQAGQFITGE